MRPVRATYSLIALFALLAGCGTAGPGAALAPARVQQTTWNLKSDAGTFTVRFAGLRRGYHTLATVQDIASVRLTLTSPRLTAPLTQTVGSAQLAQPVVNVSFSNVPAGDVQVQVQAIDANGVVIGAKQSDATVTSGQTSVLQMTVTLDADTGAGNLATVVSFENPSPTPDATATASPAATPTPSATPTRGPIALEGDKLVRHLFSDPDAQITLANSGAASATATVYVYFFSGNTLKDSQAYRVTLAPGQQATQTVHARSYMVDRVVVQVQ